MHNNDDDDEWWRSNGDSFVGFSDDCNDLSSANGVDGGSCSDVADDSSSGGDNSNSGGGEGEEVMKIKAQRIRGARAFTTYIGNSILIMENSDLGGCETLETPYIFLFPSVLSFITILIWSCFILERFILQVKVEVYLI